MARLVLGNSYTHSVGFYGCFNLSLNIVNFNLWGCSVGDSFDVLKKVLLPLFNCEAKRQDKYVFAPIRQLKKALDHYHPEQDSTFKFLVDAIIASMPYIEKWHLNFEDIQSCMDALAQNHAIQPINWKFVLAKSKDSPRFQFGRVLSDEDLIPWLESKMGKSFQSLESREKTQILTQYLDNSGFSKKLSAYIDKNPNFLFQLMMDSGQNFMQIAGNRLNLYVTDKQMAMAILKHYPGWAAEHRDEFKNVEHLESKLNDLLSNGRSIATILRSAEAKSILDAAEIFQHYQSDNYKNRYQEVAKPPSLAKDKF